jgi:hypothetical protein
MDSRVKPGNDGVDPAMTAWIKAARLGQSGDYWIVRSRGR